jgi:hypothetical protein
MKLTKRNLKFAWKHRAFLWKYRNLIRRRREIGGMAAAAAAVGIGMMVKRRWCSRELAAPASGV